MFARSSRELSFDYLVADTFEPPRKARRLADLLVADGVITQRQLKPRSNGSTVQPPRKLGEILIDERVTSAQRDPGDGQGARDGVPVRRPAGAARTADARTSSRCLAYQRQHPGTRVGEIALDKEFVAERQLLLAVSITSTAPSSNPTSRCSIRRC